MHDGFVVWIQVARMHLTTSGIKARSTEARQDIATLKQLHYTITSPGALRRSSRTFTFILNTVEKRLDFTKPIKTMAKRKRKWLQKTGRQLISAYQKWRPRAILDSHSANRKHRGTEWRENRDHKKRLARKLQEEISALLIKEMGRKKGLETWAKLTVCRESHSFHILK